MGYYDRQAVSGQLVSHVPNSYAERTSRPICALVFLLGFLAVFIIGTLMMQPTTISQSLDNPKTQVVAFIIVKDFMEFIGFSATAAFFGTPLVLVIILFALQFTSKTPWRVRHGDLFLMLGECILLSIPLLVLSLLLNRGAAVSNAAQGMQIRSMLSEDIITGIGAGIYEELVFRLILICILMLIFQDLFGVEKKMAVILSVIISAILFSLFHHIYLANWRLHSGDTFTIGKFVFRAIAGCYFAALYAVRGFGITAGTHALYNVFAALARTLLFVIPTE